MYKILNKKEIELFADRYLKDYKGEIYKVSMLKYGNFVEYLVNEHFLVSVIDKQVILKDSQ